MLISGVSRPKRCERHGERNNSASSFDAARQGTYGEWMSAPAAATFFARFSGRHELDDLHLALTEATRAGLGDEDGIAELGCAAIF